MFEASFFCMIPIEKDRYFLEYYTYCRMRSNKTAIQTSLYIRVQSYNNNTIKVIIKGLGLKQIEVEIKRNMKAMIQ
jgi:hypothetical protein